MLFRHAGVTSRGLSASEVESRMAKFGLNKMTPPQRKTIFHRLWEQLNNSLILILCICAIVSGVFREWPDLGLIIAVIVINVVIGLIQVL